MSEKESGPGNGDALPPSTSASSSDFTSSSDSTAVRRATSREKALSANELSYIHQSSKENLLELSTSNPQSAENGNNELSALLSNDKEPDNADSDNEEKEMERTLSRLQQWPAKLHIVTELFRMAELLAPTFFLYLILFSRFMVCFSLIHQLGIRHLSTSSLAFSFCNATGYAVLIGFASAMDTMASQAYGGQHYKHIGLLLQKYVFYMAALSIPISILWFNVESIFLAFNQDPAVAKEAGSFAAWLIPDLMIHSVLIPLQSFLRSQCVMKPMVVISIVSFLSHIPFSFFFILNLDLGSKGAGVALFFSSLLFLSLLIFYLLHSEVFKRCQEPLSVQVFQEWQSLLKLALPSFLLTCLEWWSYEIVYILSSFLPSAFEGTGTLAIMLNIDSLFYLILFTLSSITSTRVGMLLGSNSPATARHAAIISLGVSLVLGLIIFVSILVFRSSFENFYSEPILINSKLQTSSLILAFVEFINPLHTCCMGIFVGLAYQKLAVVILVFSFYIMGLPLGAVLAFILGLHVHGLLIGIVLSLLLSCGLSLTILSKVDWIVECDRVSSSFSHLGKEAGHVQLSDLDDI